jgi:hypothetical protein
LTQTETETASSSGFTPVPREVFEEFLVLPLLVVPLGTTVCGTMVLVATVVIGTGVVTGLVEVGVPVVPADPECPPCA